MGGVQRRRVEEHVFTPLLHGESQRKVITSNNLRKSPAQTNRNGRNYGRTVFFYCGDAGISLVAMEGR